MRVAGPRYAPVYCEENVWWLAQEPRFAGLRAEVVVVSNVRRTVALFHQRAALSGEPVVWDYHVVLAVHARSGVEVMDLDCVLGAPLAGSAWLDASFDDRVPVRFAPLFCVIPSEVFVATFSSDRRHMREAGGWRAPVPPWPIIGGGAHELERLIDVQSRSFGPVTDLAGLHARWR